MTYKITYRKGARVKIALVNADDFFEAAQRCIATFDIKSQDIISNEEADVNQFRRDATGHIWTGRIAS